MHNRYREEEKEEMKKTKQKKEKKIDISLNEEFEEKLANEIEDDFILTLEDEVKKYKEQYLRVLAESENFKKRINDERIRERKYFNQSLFERMVNTIDIFDQTVNIKTDDQKLNNFLVGFKMINNELKQILEDEGVKLIDSLGQKFDPTVHHAIETGYDETKEDDIIIEEIRRGYKYKDRVLRVALVKVNKLEKQEENKEEQNNG